MCWLALRVYQPVCKTQEPHPATFREKGVQHWHSLLMNTPSFSIHPIWRIADPVTRVLVIYATQWDELAHAGRYVWCSPDKNTHKSLPLRFWHVCMCGSQQSKAPIITGCLVCCQMGSPCHFGARQPFCLVFLASSGFRAFFFLPDSFFACKTIGWVGHIRYLFGCRIKLLELMGRAPLSWIIPPWA